MNDTKVGQYEHLWWAAGGLLAGAWWVKNQVEEQKRSRAEQENGDEVAGICEEVGELLDSWEPSTDCDCEDDFRDDLADYLEAATDLEIEVAPDTPCGRPDILIADILALELKIDPSKAERDRCIGQCAGYSREWVTWIVMVDAPASKIRMLESLLEDKGLNRLLIWNFK